MSDEPGTTYLVDAGRTGVRLARWDGAHATPLTDGPGLPMLAEADGPVAAARAIADLLPRGGRVGVIAGGLTGLMEVPERRTEISRALLEATGATGVVLASDVVTSHLGALGGRSGVVAAVGTGTVVLGLNAAGEAAKVDGWGYLLGDAGSGFEVGRRGLAAAMAAHDGRRASALQAAAQARFGPLDALPGRVYAQAEPVHVIASFAPAVAEAARAGDEVALRIWDTAAAAVSEAITAALDGAQLVGTDRRVAFAGSLGRLDLLQDRVRARLDEGARPPAIVEPRGDALSGAGSLLRAEVRAWLGPLAYTFPSVDPPAPAAT